MPRHLSLGAVEGTLRVVFAGGIHFTAALPETRKALERLPNAGEVELIQAPADQLAKAMRHAHVALPFMERFDAALLQGCPDLRCVLQFGVGLEGVDVEECSRLGIAVSNMPAHDSGNAEATAEHALYLILSLLRLHRELPRRFASSQLGGMPIPRQVSGKRATVVGYGAIGKRLCQYLRTMGAEVVAVRRRPWAEHEGAELRDRGDLGDLRTRFASQTDVLALACPLNDETRGLLGTDLISVLKPGCVAVNVGRGPLADHDAVLLALNTGALKGFASDVGVGHPHKPPEPWDPLDELSLHPAALFTPHVGGVTDGSYGNMGMMCARAVLRVREGKPPVVWVNDAAFQPTSTL